MIEVSCFCAWALEVSWLCSWEFEVSCLCAWAFVIRYYLSELSLEVQGGQDYFRFVEGTCINCLCSASSIFSLFIIPLHTLLVIPHFLTVSFLFYSSFKLVLSSCFLQFLHFYFTVFYQFFSTFYISISQHFICTLCKHFTRLFSNFYPLKSHFLSIRFTAFRCYLLIFYSLL